MSYKNIFGAISYIIANIYLFDQRTIFYVFVFQTIFSLFLKVTALPLKGGAGRGSAEGLLLLRLYGSCSSSSSFGVQSAEVSPAF